MLCLKRRAGQCVTITHVMTGDVIRVELCELDRGKFTLAFADDARNYRIEREERRAPVSAQMAE